MHNVEHDKLKSDLAELHNWIVQYLQNNPNAADSLEGIVDCWLPQAYENVDAAKIVQVLEQLIAEGLVKRVILVGGTVLYRQGKSRG